MDRVVGSKQVTIIHASARETAAIIREVMGEWHAYYAEAAMKTSVAKSIAAKINDSLAGVLVYYKVDSLRGPLIIIYYIVTKNIVRRRGIGSILLNSIEDREKPVAQLATISRGNKASISFFRAEGFEVLSYNDIARRYGRELLRKITRLACGYEDEYAVVKPPYKGWLTISSIEWRLINNIFNEICYKPWKALLAGEGNG